MEDEIRRVLDKSEYRGLFAEKPAVEIINQRLAAHGVNAKATHIRLHPEGGFQIDFVSPNDHGAFIHQGWDE